jgi:hypothetical protein
MRCRARAVIGNVTYDAQRAAQNIATPEFNLTGYDLIARELLSVD